MARRFHVRIRREAAARPAGDGEMFISRELQDFLETAIPVLVKAGVVYLILRFTFAVSNVLIRLAVLNRPERPVEDTSPSDDSPDAVEADEEAGDQAEPAALPESTGDN